MKEYMKMADVFVGEYKPKRRIDAWPPSKHGETLVDISGKPAEYAVHAINSHDELVSEVERLRVIIDIKPMANRYNNDIDDFVNVLFLSGV